MRTKTVATIFILVYAALAYGVQGEWIKFSSPEGRFSVLLPHQPTLDKDTNTLITTYSFMSLAAGMAFTGTYADIPSIDSDPDTFLKDTRDVIVSKTGPMTGSDEKISLDSYPGREFEVAIVLPKGAAMSARIRIYLVGKRLYSLTYISEKDSDAKVNAENMARFFSSFKVTSE